ncbi:hypothetical protein HK105_203433 [Polyrhizophydium stewartii]|uniref:ABC transporter domain-containing protein n=1 Tax=Polyrhizophydium stewartii TaxID=2732419 RepID=A0ABR4NBY8_9FUNG
MPGDTPPVAVVGGKTVAIDKQFQVGRSRQATALARKAMSFQKRQWFTNVCCIALCPFMMVFISALLGKVIESLINNLTKANDFVYCSNVNASDANGIPYWVADDPRIPTAPANGLPGSTNPVVYHANFATVVAIADNAAVGAATLGFKHPCTFWYGENYPQKQGSVYEPVSGVSGNLARDATFLSEPISGWFQTLVKLLSTKVDPSDTVNYKQIQNTQTVFQNGQKRSWVVYGVDPSVDPNLIGTKTQQPSLPLNQFLAAPSGPAFVSPQNATTGLFGTIPTRFYLDISSLSANASINMTSVPWFNPVGGDDNAIDDQIGSIINTAILEIAKVDKSGLLKGDRGEANKVLLEVSKVLKILPHGGLYINKIDHANKKYSFNMHFGTDIRVAGGSNFPNPGDRQLIQLTQLTNAILRNSDVAKLGGASITQGLRILPLVKNTKFEFAFGGLIGGILYPFGVSFLLPIFVIMLVQEKETRIFVMMKMNGMRSTAYYGSQYITLYVLFAVSTIIFLIVGYSTKLTLFTLTDTGVLLLLFFIWGHNQIALSFFFTALFNRSRTALVMVFLLVLCSVIISLALNLLFRQGAQLPGWFFIWPPFAFYRALSQINRASYTPNQQPYKMSNLTKGDEVFTAMMFLIAEIPIYLGVAAYLSAVLPSEFGVRLPWHFPITAPLKALQRSSRTKANGGVDPKSEANLAMAAAVNVDETKFEDADVKAERARVDNGEFDAGSPLVVRHMRKVYAGRGGAGPKLAVKDVTFAVEEGIVFGLLGPNGAGKTTLISILTGLYEASTGTGTLAGFDVTTDTAEVYKRIGICPQFDILWDDLTVSEHLYFYARLKGISPSEEREAVRIAMANVALTGYENRLSKGLSGGEKRRLSIAIALLGSPKVVFLDEPTTGLDPEVRRLIWNIVNNSKQGKTIVLTTHSMEEAEALCQRIGIMAKGTLRCLANPIRLKQVYGTGFRIYFNSLEDDTPRASAFVESLLPAGWKKVDAFATNVSYEFPAVAGSLSMLFKQIEQHKVENGILDWGVGQTTLEDVFISLISESDADADAD